MDYTIKYLADVRMNHLTFWFFFFSKYHLSMTHENFNAVYYVNGLGVMLKS